MKRKWGNWCSGLIVSLACPKYSIIELLALFQQKTTENLESWSLTSRYSCECAQLAAWHGPRVRLSGSGITELALQPSLQTPTTEGCGHGSLAMNSTWRLTSQFYLVLASRTSHDLPSLPLPTLPSNTSFSSSSRDEISHHLKLGLKNSPITDAWRQIRLLTALLGERFPLLLGLPSAQINEPIWLSRVHLLSGPNYWRKSRIIICLYDH